ncbi:MAG TPA: hypothetical protein VMT20_28040 [Terriglobia bacterium]|nr:hypothetical protein [Terriglobia bacterium]
MQAQDKMETFIEQLGDPCRSSQALMALLALGKDSVPALVHFLRSTKPSSLAESRLLAVEGLSILKGPLALGALIAVATQRLAEIGDPAVRLAEEAVASCAALALASFSDPHAHEALLDLLDEKPLIGVAEAFEKLRDPRAIPHLVSWLEEDFVAEAAGRSILGCGPAAVPALLDSLKEKHPRYGTESGMSQRRRARILEILCELALPDPLEGLDGLLDDAVEGVRFNAARLLLRKGSAVQRRRAYQVGLEVLDSRNNDLRANCEESLRAHFDVGSELVEEEIRRRRLAGESEDLWPRETALAILLRIERKGSGRAG